MHHHHSCFHLVTWKKELNKPAEDRLSGCRLAFVCYPWMDPPLQQQPSSGNCCRPRATIWKPTRDRNQNVQKQAAPAVSLSLGSMTREQEVQQLTFWFDFAITRNNNQSLVRFFAEFMKERKRLAQAPKKLSSPAKRLRTSSPTAGTSSGFGLGAHFGAMLKRPRHNWSAWSDWRNELQFVILFYFFTSHCDCVVFPNFFNYEPFICSARATVANINR